MNVIYTPEAKAELDGAATYYRLKSPKAALSFQHEFNAVMERVQTSPQQFPFVGYGVRRAVTQRFPYNIFFEQHDDVILVVGVIHGSRDPFLRQNR